MSFDDLEQCNRTYHAAQDQMELLPNYYEWTYRKFRRYLKGQVVELGCGSGIGISTYLDRVTKVYAVDFNDELVRRVNQRFQSAKVVPIQADLLGEWTQLSTIKADAVIMMDVLEHFADDTAVVEKTLEPAETEWPSPGQSAGSERPFFRAWIVRPVTFGAMTKKACGR